MQIFGEAGYSLKSHFWIFLISPGPKDVHGLQKPPIFRTKTHSSHVFFSLSNCPFGRNKVWFDKFHFGESPNQRRKKYESPKAYLCLIATRHDDLESLCFTETLNDIDHHDSQKISSKLESFLSEMLKCISEIMS